MRVLKLLCLIPLCVMLTSCTKPFTNFETSRAKMQKLSGFNVIQCDEILEKSLKDEEEILKNKGLVDYKQQYFKNNHKIQINQYEISYNARSTGSIMIKNSTGDTLLSTPINGKDAIFNISYDKKYLGICDKGKMRIFDIDNNLYEINQYKDMQCTGIYFSLDNTYLIVNNKNQGQIYEFKRGNLVYDNPNNPLFVSLDYAIAGNEIILLDENKRIIVEGLEDSSSYEEEIIEVRKNKEGIDVLIWEGRKSWAPFVSFPPSCSIRRLQGF